VPYLRVVEKWTFESVRKEKELQWIDVAQTLDFAARASLLFSY